MITVTSSDTGVTYAYSGNRAALSVRNFIRLWQGEVPFARGMGIPPELIHMRVPEAKEWLLANLPEMFAKYVPEADILDIRVERAEDGRIQIEVDVNE